MEPLILFSIMFFVAIVVGVPATTILSWIKSKFGDKPTTMRQAWKKCSGFLDSA